jgi:hypothetical protein
VGCTSSVFATTYFEELFDVLNLLWHLDLGRQKCRIDVGVELVLFKAIPSSLTSSRDLNSRQSQKPWYLSLATIQGKLCHVDHERTHVTATQDGSKLDYCKGDGVGNSRRPIIQPEKLLLRFCRDHRYHDCFHAAFRLTDRED